MKRLLNISRYAAAILSAFAFLAACTPEITHYRGHGDWPGDFPGREGGSGSGKSGTNVLDYGYANYYGNFYDTDPATDNFLVYLYSGATDKDGYFTKKGMILTLDILSRPSSTMTIASGEYRCSDEGGAMTFVPTYQSYNADTDKYNDYDGSSLYYQTDKNTYSYYKILDGTVKITRKVTGNYEIEAKVVTDIGDCAFTFKGMINIEDDRGGDEPGGDEPGGDKPVDVNFPMPEGSEWTARAQYNGYCADNSKVDEYTLYLSAGPYASNGVDFKTSGTEIAIEVLTGNGDGKSIPSGTYSCTSDDPQPFRFYDGFEQNGELYPSYFYRQYSSKEGDYSLESITSGSLIVERIGSTYKISFAYGCGSGSYKINYEGGVDFYDSPDLTKAAGPKVASRTSAEGRKLPAVSRKAGVNRVER